MNFKNKTKPQNAEKKQKKDDILKNQYTLFNSRERVLDAFKSKIFPTKTKGTSLLNLDHSKLKILTPQQMIQKLPIALA